MIAPIGPLLHHVGQNVGCARHVVLEECGLESSLFVGAGKSGLLAFIENDELVLPTCMEFHRKNMNNQTVNHGRVTINDNQSVVSSSIQTNRG